MTPHRQPAQEPLGEILARLRTVLLAQADALSAEDFEHLDRLDAEREQLVAGLGAYTAADTGAEDQPLLDQIAALDQRLLALAREELRRTEQEMREVNRGRGALNVYRQRGQRTIRGLAILDLEG